MERLLGMEFPGKESFNKARQFLTANSPLSNKEYLRLFLRKYGDRINCEATAKALVILFEGIEGDGKKPAHGENYDAK
jgi:hypothetical protein